MLFLRKNWTPKKAITWLKKHKYKHYKIDITDKYLRFRQFDPNKKKKHRIKKITNDIKYIFEF